MLTRNLLFLKCFVLLMFVVPHLAMAQTLESPVDACEKRGTISWALTLQRDLPFLEGFVRGKPVKFLVDTGFPYSVILPATVKKLRLQTTLPETASGKADAIVKDVEFSKSVIGNDNFTWTMPIDTMRVKKLTFPLKVDGVIGLDFLQEYTLHLDYVTPAIHWYLRKDPPAFTNPLIVPLPENARRVYLSVTLNDVEYPLLLDTGFSGTVDFTAYTLGKNTLPDAFRVIGEMLSGTAYGTETNLIRWIPSLNLGKGDSATVWHNTSGLFPDPATKVKPDEVDEGMVGYELLRYYDIYFLPQKKQVALVKNKFYSDRWLDRAFGIVTKEETGERRVTAVVPESSAAKKGVKEGDTVIEYMNAPVAQLKDPHKMPGTVKQSKDEISLAIRSAETKSVSILKLKFGSLY